MSLQTDEVQSRRRWSRRTLGIVLTAALLLAALWPAMWYARSRIEANAVFREAKDVRLAMRLLSSQYLASDRQIADSSSPDGFSDGTAAEILDTAGASGTLTLLGWDDSAGAPLRFLYENRGIRVWYTWDPAADETHWEVDRPVRLLRF